MEGMLCLRSTTGILFCGYLHHRSSTRPPISRFWNIAQFESFVDLFGRWICHSQGNLLLSSQKLLRLRCWYIIQMILTEGERMPLAPWSPICTIYSIIWPSEIAVPRHAVQCCSARSIEACIAKVFYIPDQSPHLSARVYRASSISLARFSLLNGGTLA